MSKTMLCCGLVGILCAPRLAISGEDNALRVEAAGLRIVAPQPDDYVQAFESASGTTVALLVKSSAGGIVKFDEKNCAISKFTDEKGNDLLAKPKQESTRTTPTVGFSNFPRISADGKVCCVEISGPSVPAKGSSLIKLEGVVTVLSATAKKEFVQKDVAIQNGTKVVAGALEFTLQKVAATGRKDEPLTLSLSTFRQPDELAEIRFYRADGTEIKARKSSTSLMAIMGATTVEWFYELSEKVDTATIKFFVWSDLQKTKVPFSLDVNVGL
jgi:hypothetical protein